MTGTDKKFVLPFSPESSPQVFQQIYNAQAGKCACCENPVILIKSHYILNQGLYCLKCWLIIQVLGKRPDVSLDDLVNLMEEAINETIPTGTPEENVTDAQWFEVSEVLYRKVVRIKDKK